MRFREYSGLARVRMSDLLRRLAVPGPLELILVPWAVLWGIGSRPLYEPDEGRYALGALGMLASGDWVLPTLHGVPYIDKPPLLYWLEAIGALLVGESERGLRLLPALACLASAWLTYRLGKELFGRRAGVLAAGVLATSFLYLGVARVLVPDGALTTGVVAAYLGFVLIHHGKPGAVWLWGGLIFGCLAKGPVAIAEFGPAAALYWFLASPRPPLRHFRPIPGIAALALAVVPWSLAVESRVPGYLAYFMGDQNLRALYTPGIHHAAPWYMAALFVVAGFLPWSPLLVWVRTGREASRAWLPLLWAGFTILLFTLSVSKLPAYYLPAMPALALLVGWSLERGSEARVAGLTLLGLGPTAVCVGAALLRLPPVREIASPLLVAGVLVWCVGVSLAGALLRSGRAIAAVRALLALTAIALTAAHGGIEGLNETRSPRGFLVRNRSVLDRCETLLLGRFPTGMAELYLSRPVILIGTNRDYSIGRELLPESLTLPDPEEVERLLRSGPHACVLARSRSARALRSVLGELREIAHSEEYALLATAGPNEVDGLEEARADAAPDRSRSP